MDFNKLAKAIYEMDEVLLTVKARWGSIRCLPETIGRVNDGEDDIEIVFEDDSTWIINKDHVQVIDYSDNGILIVYNNNDSLFFEVL